MSTNLLLAENFQNATQRVASRTIEEFEMNEKGVFPGPRGNDLVWSDSI
jgi:hypothetical protein